MRKYITILFITLIEATAAQYLITYTILDGSNGPSALIEIIIMSLALLQFLSVAGIISLLLISLKRKLAFKPVD